MTEERTQNRGPNCSRDTSNHPPCEKKAICPNCYIITELKITRRSICIPNISSVICSFDTSNDQLWTGNLQWLRIFFDSLAIAGFVISVKILGLKFVPYIAESTSFTDSEICWRYLYFKLDTKYIKNVYGKYLWLLDQIYISMKSIIDTDWFLAM